MPGLALAALSALEQDDARLEVDTGMNFQTVPVIDNHDVAWTCGSAPVIYQSVASIRPCKSITQSQIYRTT